MSAIRNTAYARKHAPDNLGRVLVLGLGKTGKAACRYCFDLLGTRVQTLAVAAGDDVLGAQLFMEELLAGASMPATCELLVSQDLSGHIYDVCIVSPGISQFSDFYQSAAAVSTEIISEVEFAWRESNKRSRWIGITGTNGKTTTTALLTHILHEAGLNAVAVGNIGDTCLEAVSKGNTDIYVAEVSSYQLASTHIFAPNIAILLNIKPDHLAWHKTYQAYVAAKMKLFAQLAQTPDALAILDATDDEARMQVKSFKAQSAEERGFAYVPLGAAAGLEADMRQVCGAENAAFVRNGQLFFAFGSKEHALAPLEDLQIQGVHNISNALAAAVAASALGVDDATITRALSSFAALEHRIEPCGTVSGIRCFNDSKATNVDATLKALTAFEGSPLVVLLGGEDKGTTLHGLVRALEKQQATAVCFGAAGLRFMQVFKGSSVPVFLAEGLEDAFDTALAHAHSEGVILLSPACASFDEFQSFEERGTVFKDLVAQRSMERGA